MLENHKNITMIENAIHNPNEPRHFMVIEENQPVTVRIGETVIAETEKSMKVKEVARTVYDPVLYIPRSDIKMDLLSQNEKTTKCPLKGQTVYYDLNLGTQTYENAAWSYEHVLDFDERLQLIKDHIAFDRSMVSISLHS